MNLAVIMNKVVAKYACYRAAGTIQTRTGHRVGYCLGNPGQPK